MVREYVRTKPNEKMNWNRRKMAAFKCREHTRSDPATAKCICSFRILFSYNLFVFSLSHHQRCCARWVPRKTYLPLPISNAFYIVRLLSHTLYFVNFYLFFSSTSTLVFAVVVALQRLKCIKICIVSTFYLNLCVIFFLSFTGFFVCFVFTIKLREHCATAHTHTQSHSHRIYTVWTVPRLFAVRILFVAIRIESVSKYTCASQAFPFDSAKFLKILTQTHTHTHSL